jgi:polar amino acid transport system substrate-binding protein
LQCIHYCINADYLIINLNKIIGISIGIIIISISLGSFFFFENTFVQQEESSVSTGTSYDAIMENDRKLLLVIDENFPPFSFKVNGIATGIDVEILELAMSRLEIPFETKALPWSRALKMVETGEADVLVGAGYSDERAEYLYFTKDQVTSQKTGKLPESYSTVHDVGFFIRQIHEDSLDFESLEQIKEMGYRVGVDAGYVYNEILVREGLDIIEYNSGNESFLALNRGEIDMYLGYQNVGLWILDGMELQNEITYIDKPLFSYTLLAPFSKTSDYPNLKEIWEQTNNELEKIHENNEVEAIYDRYILKE